MIFFTHAALAITLRAHTPSGVATFAQPNVATRAASISPPATESSFRPSLATINRDVATAIASVRPTNATCSCGDRRVIEPIAIAAQAVDSTVVSNAIHRGDVGIGPFGTHSAIGYFIVNAAVDIVLHRFERHAPCALRRGTDLILAGAAINNAANTRFP